MVINAKLHILPDNKVTLKGLRPSVQEGVVQRNCTDEQCKLRIDANVIRSFSPLTQMPCYERPFTGDSQGKYAEVMPVTIRLMTEAPSGCLRPLHSEKARSKVNKNVQKSLSSRMARNKTAGS